MTALALPGRARERCGAGGAGARLSQGGRVLARASAVAPESCGGAARRPAGQLQGALASWLGAEGWAATPRLLSMIAFDDALDSTTGASAGHRRCHPRPAGSRTAIEHQVRHCRQSLSDSSDDDTQSDGSTTSTSPPPPPTRDERPRPLSSACLRRTTTRLRHTCTTSTSTRAFTGADTVQRARGHGAVSPVRRMLLEHQQLDARSLGSQVALSVVRVQSLRPR